MLKQAAPMGTAGVTLATRGKHSNAYDRRLQIAGLNNEQRAYRPADCPSAGRDLSSSVQDLPRRSTLHRPS